MSPDRCGLPVDGEGSQTTVLIVDHPPTRTGIRMILGPGVEVCAEAGDADQAVRAARREQPQVALIGREIGHAWRAAVSGICRAAPACGVIVLAQAGDVDDMLDAVRAGAVGYVPGPLDAERLQRVFRAVAGREAVVPRAMVIDLLGELRMTRATANGLTGREAQVLGMLRRGHSTAGIAEHLQITPVTVRRHISELVHKLGVDSRSDLLEHGAG